MTGSVLFRKLVLSAFLLTAAILLPLDIYFTNVESGLQIGEVHVKLFEIGLAAALIAVVLAYFASRSVTRRLARLRAFADGFVDARSFPAPIAATVNDEVGSLV